MAENKKTCLYDKHVALGAMISPFGGFDMPIQYSNIKDEHLAVRQKVGIFDVSHMGEVEITGEEWKEAKRHKRQSFDVFGYNGHQTQHVRLRLSMRAKNRLLDQYPMTIRAVSQINGCSEWYFDARLCSYRAVARFYQAFCDEVEILEGEGLEDYAIECMEKQLQIAKAKRDMKRLAETPTPETQHTA